MRIGSRQRTSGPIRGARNPAQPSRRAVRTEIPSCGLGLRCGGACCTRGIIASARNLRAVQVLVTGATGKVGNAVARSLAGRGDRVRALVRDPERARPLLPGSVELVAGDVTDPASIERAVAGCELVFTAHGLPEQWVEDPGIFDRVN